MPDWKERIHKAGRRYHQNVKNVRPDDVNGTARKGMEKLFDFGTKHPGTLVGMWEDIKLMIALIRDYARGDYREIPWSSIAAITAAVIYLVNPIDIIPDFIPVAGFLDDAAVITIALKLVRDDLHKYRDWRTKQKFDGICADGIEEADFEEIEE